MTGLAVGLVRVLVRRVVHHVVHIRRNGLGIRIDATRNREPGKDVRAVHSDDGAVAVLVVPTNEELEIAEQTLRCVALARVGKDGA